MISSRTFSAGLAHYDACTMPYESPEALGATAMAGLERLTFVSYAINFRRFKPLPLIWSQSRCLDSSCIL